MRLVELAQRLQGRCDGPDCELTGIASLEAAVAGDLSFVTDPRRAAAATHTRASALLVGDNFPPLATPGLALLRVAQPALAMAAAVALLRPPWRPSPGIAPTAQIHPSARLGARCHVGAYAVVGEGCRLGDDAVLHPHVVLYPHVHAGHRLLAHAHVVIREGSVLGDDVILQPGVVLGGDGFGFAADADGHHLKIPQVGTVSLGDRVEIQANSCVDRASLEVTRIGHGTKVDNLTQIGHNCTLGEDVLLCAQVGLAGSTRIQDRALLAGQVGVAGHCTIGRGAVITAQSGTHGDLAPGGMYSGTPAFDHRLWLRATAVFARLGELQREVRALRASLPPTQDGPPLR